MRVGITTFSSYGEISPKRQAEIIRGLAMPGGTTDDLIGPELLRNLADRMELASKLSR